MKHALNLGKRLVSAGSDTHVITAGVNTYQIVHNLGNTGAALIGFSTTWPTGVFVTATGLNTIDVEFSNGAPVGGGTFISQVQIV